MDLFKSALSLVIHKEGDVVEADVDDLISRYKKKRAVDIDKPSYMTALDQALKHYDSRKLCMFVCNEAACAEKAFVGAAGPSMSELESLMPCAVEETGCHWKCELAPVLTLKQGDTQTVFANCSSDQSLHSILQRTREILRYSDHFSS
jgi:hypothetical protein